MSFSVVMEQRSVRRPTHRRNYHPSYKNESQEVFHDTVRWILAQSERVCSDSNSITQNHFFVLGSSITQAGKTCPTTQKVFESNRKRARSFSIESN